VGLAFLDPARTPQISLCLLHNLGVPCPGCGLGRSITYFFQGQMAASFWTHPLGIPAVIIISQRIIHLSQNMLNSYRSDQSKS
jgi:hypothetical protein